MEENKFDPTIAYDIVELPSRGIHYENKKKSLKVAYLTAADEDVLSAQNLIQANSTIDELLKRKILDKDINYEEIVEEDKQAVLMFLRNTAWGSGYKITLIDPKPKEGYKYLDENGTFQTDIDLSVIKMKPFTLTPDDKDEFTYHCKKSNVKLTFKFITRLQEVEIEEIKLKWNSDGVPPQKTKELEMMIKSIDDIRDPMRIRSFIIDKMPIKDSQDFRRFVAENKPGLDLTQTIIAPSGEKITTIVGFGVEFFRPFYGL